MFSVLLIGCGAAIPASFLTAAAYDFVEATVIETIGISRIYYVFAILMCPFSTSAPYWPCFVRTTVTDKQKSTTKVRGLGAQCLCV